MSDERRDLNPDAYALDDILQEVTSWFGPGEKTAAPPDAPEYAATGDPITQVPESEYNAFDWTPTAVDAPEEPPEQAEGERPEDSPDNLIPLFPKEEPETIREAARLTTERLNLWLRLRREQFRAPKLKIKKFGHSLRLPSLPDLPPPPDKTPKELSYEYNKGLGILRLQCFLALLFGVILLGLAIFSATPTLPLPASWRMNGTAAWVSLGFFPVVVALCYPVLLRGTVNLVKGQPGMESLATMATLVTLIDATTMLFGQLRPMSMPLYAPCAFVLAFQLLGIYWKRRALRLSCRTAAMVAEPDLMTVEPSQWNGKAVYRRRPGDTTGFGSKIQQEDGAEQSFRLFAPFIFILALMLAAAATLFRQQPQLFFWSFSAGLIAGSTLSGGLCFALPFRGLSRRLSKLGAALAGWHGAKEARAGNGLLVEDTDLFPPGSVELTSYRIFGGYDADTILSVTASLIRASGSGLDTLFYNLLRTEGGAYVTVTELEVRNDGISAKALGDAVLVGNLSFLEREGVAIPTGVRVKTGVFCAIAGEFSGQFILEYTMHKASGPAMDSMLQNGITPVLIGLDFNLVPAVLRRQFRFPWDEMAFPEIGQRAKLARAPFAREGQLMAVLCLEGLASVAITAAGAQRLRTAVRMCSRLTCLGAIIGAMMVFYLSLAGSLSALSAVSMTFFLLLWFLPTPLISGWVNQF